MYLKSADLNIPHIILISVNAVRTNFWTRERKKDIEQGLHSASHTSKYTRPYGLCEDTNLKREREGEREWERERERERECTREDIGNVTAKSSS